MKKIAIGDKFTLPAHAPGFPPLQCERLPDDPAPAFECERMIVKVHATKTHPYEHTFPVEPEWFYQRKLDFQP